MIFNLVMKTPGATVPILKNLQDSSYCNEDEAKKAKEMLSSILEHDEYLTVQVDTKAETFTVLKNENLGI